MESVNSYRCRRHLLAKKYTLRCSNSSARAILGRNMNIAHLKTYRRIIISFHSLSLKLEKSWIFINGKGNDGLVCSLKQWINKNGWAIIAGNDENGLQMFSKKPGIRNYLSHVYRSLHINDPLIRNPLIEMPYVELWTKVQMNPDFSFSMKISHMGVEFSCYIQMSYWILEWPPANNF